MKKSLREFRCRKRETVSFPKTAGENSVRRNPGQHGSKYGGKITTKEEEKNVSKETPALSAGRSPVFCGVGGVGAVMSALESNGIKAVKIPAGISGHKSNQMLARLERDVIRKKPQIMTLSCGVNDVWHGKRGVPLDQYKKNITAIVDKAQAAGIKVYILTATMISENPQSDNNKKLVAYNEFLRELAKKKNCKLVDLNADMQRQITSIREKYPRQKGNLLTVDGVHMNPLGNIMMAKGILRAFGLTDAQIAKAEPLWEKKTFQQGFWLSVKEYKALAEKAFQANMSVSDYLKDLVRKTIQ